MLDQNVKNRLASPDIKYQDFAVLVQTSPAVQRPMAVQTVPHCIEMQT